MLHAAAGRGWLRWLWWGKRVRVIERARALRCPCRYAADQLQVLVMAALESGAPQGYLSALQAEMQAVDTAGSTNASVSVHEQAQLEAWVRTVAAARCVADGGALVGAPAWRGTARGAGAHAVRACW